MAEDLVPEESMARNYEQELSELKEEFEKLQEHLSNVEVRYQTEIQETSKQKENDFAVQLLNVVTNLFGRSQYSDLKILLENGNELCVHKLVLLSRSDDWDVPDLDEVDVLDLKGVKYDVAYSMLKWVYTDQIEFEENEENLVEMLKLSTKYKLEPLQIRCQNFMIEIVNVDNCNTFNQAANETASELLKDYCQEFLSKHQMKRSKRKSKTREESEGDESYIATDELNCDFEQEQLDKSSLKTPQIYPYICNLCRKAIHEPSDEPAHSVLHAECLYRSCAHCGEKSENSKSEISKKQFFRYKHPASQELRYFCKSCANKKEVVGSLELCKNRLTDITCGRCSYHSQNRSHVLDHINTHTGAKPHVCDFCGIGFSHTVSLMSHRLIHTGEKPHQCADCGRQFRRKFHLNRHRLIHNGGKPYQCVHCGLFFRQSNTLKFHIQTHTGVKPHSCNLCDRQFCDRRSLRKHKESHHDQLRADDTSNVTTVNVMISDIPVVYEEMNIVNTELTGLPTE